MDDISNRELTLHANDCEIVDCKLCVEAARVFWLQVAAEQRDRRKKQARDLVDECVSRRCGLEPLREVVLLMSETVPKLNGPYQSLGLDLQRDLAAVAHLLERMSNRI